MIPPPDPVIDAMVAEEVSKAPPPSPAQLAALAPLLRPVNLPVVKRKPRPRRAA